MEPCQKRVVQRLGYCRIEKVSCGINVDEHIFSTVGNDCWFTGYHVLLWLLFATSC